LKITIFFLYIVRHLAVFISIALEFMGMGAYVLNSYIDNIHESKHFRGIWFNQKELEAIGDK